MEFIIYDYLKIRFIGDLLENIPLSHDHHDLKHDIFE